MNFQHGGNIGEIAKKYNISEEDIIDFSSNINPLGPPENTTDLINQNIDKIAKYPDISSNSVRERVADFYHISPKSIIVDNGSAPLLYLLPGLFSFPKALINKPDFSEYGRAVISCGGIVEELNLLIICDAAISFSSLYKKSLSDFDIIFISNPNNPTGKLFDKERLLMLIEKAKSDNCMMVVDEAFMEFVEDGMSCSVIDVLEQYDNLVVIKSFTKFFAIPGLRIGCAMANEKTIERLNDIQPPWTVNVLAQSILVKFLDNKEYIFNTKDYVKKEREFLKNELEKNEELFVYDSKANYLLVKINYGEITAKDLSQRLIYENILIRDCSNFRGLDDKHFRVAVKNREDNVRLIKAIRKVISRRLQVTG